MNICFGFLGWFDLNDEVDVWDVKASRGDICCHQYSKLTLLEALHSDFSLVLSYVTVHYLDVLLDLVGEKEGIGVSLGLGKDNYLATLAIDNQNVCQGRESVLEGTLDGQMGDIFCRLVLEFYAEVDDSHVTLHVSSSYVADPSRDRRREE